MRGKSEHYWSIKTLISVHSASHPIVVDCVRGTTATKAFGAPISIKLKAALDSAKCEACSLTLAMAKRLQGQNFGFNQMRMGATHWIVSSQRNSIVGRRKGGAP